ncbi:hypothetical protein NDU88_000472 [Pleurodeles waltl]|uniref:Uncharacterized protein n=1 Tax=Pleurodeles waltl TaxID=8319 RepID=A0AAV7VXL5_PLEWA|nr:hypothetical protein NDU88_000472 [Pleurodeles waltl]
MNELVDVPGVNSWLWKYVRREEEVATHTYPEEEAAAGLQLMRLTEMQGQSLEDPINLEESQQALRQLAHGRAPGNDGLPAEYYHTFSEQTLAPYLEVLKEAFGLGRLPESQREAIIAVLPKPGRDPLDH